MGENLILRGDPSYLSRGGARNGGGGEQNFHPNTKKNKGGSHRREPRNRVVVLKDPRTREGEGGKRKDYNLWGRGKKYPGKEKSDNE